MRKLLFLLVFALFSNTLLAQNTIDEDQMGAWYMYFYNKKFNGGPLGIQGDFQYRNWNKGGDLEQLLLRSGFTFSPKNAGITFTLGYAHVDTGTPGESKKKAAESRIYQEALIPQKVGSRFMFTHRFRYEQRWVDGQDFRTRYRYNIFLNVPLNKTDLSKNAVYIAFYNELFINGQLPIGNGRTVQYFDRNRTYLGLGYTFLPKMRMQLGWMRQATTAWAKNQLQVSLHQTW